MGFGAHTDPWRGKTPKLAGGDSRQSLQVRAESFPEAVAFFNTISSRTCRILRSHNTRAAVDRAF